MKNRTGRRRAPAHRSKPTRAARADRYDLYQRSVQEPECEIVFFDRVYRARNGRLPRVLREDFCGTFAVSCEWARKRGRVATAVDLDPEPLAWGRAHNLARLPAAAQRRVRILQTDVRSVDRRKADVLAAQNFSFWAFKTRPALREYFEFARANLARGGMMVLDAMGGSDCLRERRSDVRAMRGFTYVWETERFDPISGRVVQNIHFRFPDGSRMDRAFTYDWRFWTVPEIREVLGEAGFARSTVYWEGVERRTGGGDGNWQPAEEGTADPSWVCYLVADR